MHSQETARDRAGEASWSTDSRTSIYRLPTFRVAVVQQWSWVLRLRRPASEPAHAQLGPVRGCVGPVKGVLGIKPDELNLAASHRRGGTKGPIRVQFQRHRCLSRGEEGQLDDRIAGPDTLDVLGCRTSAVPLHADEGHRKGSVWPLPALAWREPEPNLGRGRPRNGGCRGERSHRPWRPRSFRQVGRRLGHIRRADGHHGRC